MRRLSKKTLFWNIWLSVTLLSLILVCAAHPVRAQSVEKASIAVVLSAKGPLTPVLVEYLDRGLKIASDQGAQLIILQLDTPGGSIELMQNIVQKIRTSKIPVVVYVAPRGAMAGSAGTIITLAGHISAMAPETSIGAASPVGSQGEEIGETMQSKMKEMLKASVRSIAEKRGPKAIELAESTIESAKALSVAEAINGGVVDIQANDLDDLFKQLDGRKVQVDGQIITLRTLNVTTYPVENTFIEEMLQLLTNPNIVFLLLAIGVQALLIELSSPGGWLAGFIGVLCILLAVYGLGILPVNWFGILVLILAFVLFILDIKAPTHGALTAAGAGTFIAGALILFNSSRMPGFPPVSVPLVIGTSIVIAGTFFIIMTFALRAQKAPLKFGVETLVGQFGFSRSPLTPFGQVQVASELWSAEIEHGGEHLPENTRVEVVAVEGLKLVVRKATRQF